MTDVGVIASSPARPQSAVRTTPGLGDSGEIRRVCPRCRALFRCRFARCPRDCTGLVAAEYDPLVGLPFAGRYLIEELLGEGAMGRVYKAQHLRLSRRFAIKVLFGDLLARGDMIERFHREAEAASRLSHRNVVGVVDYGETDGGLVYLAMDYVGGQTLAGLLDSGPPMRTSRALALVEQLCDGLAHAHGRGLVHRDFKPDNILIEATDDGEVSRIIDFGIAILREEAAVADAARLTPAGQVVGTPQYMAPEQLAGLDVDPRTDLFALGVILYEMLAGVLPFAGSAIDVAHRYLTDDPPPIAERVPGRLVDPLAEQLALRLMARKRQDRPASAHEAAELVRALRRDRRLAAERLPLPPPRVVAAAPREAIEGPPATTAHAIAERAVTIASGSAPVARPRRSRRTPISLASIGVAAAAVLIVSRPQSPPAMAIRAAMAAPATKEAPVAPAAAAPVTSPTIAAAAVAAEPAPPPLPRRPPRPRAAPRAERPGPPPPPPPIAAAAPTPVPPRPSLAMRYRAAGEQLAALIAARGEDAGAALKSRYFALPISDALRNPDVAAEVSRRLDELARDLAAPR